MFQKNRILSAIMAVAFAFAPYASVYAASTIGTNITTDGTLSATGLSTMTGGFISNASSSVGATLSVSGAVIASSTLGVTSLTTLYSGFIANSSSSVAAALSVSGQLTTSSTLLSSGLATLYSGFQSNASSSVGAGLLVVGNLSASSTITVGGAILPNTNNSRDLGAYNLAFQNVYVSSSVFAVSSTISDPTNTTTLYIAAGSNTRGGSIVMESPSGTCYRLYIAEISRGADTLMGLTTTAAITCPNP